MVCDALLANRSLIEGLFPDLSNLPPLPTFIPKFENSIASLLKRRERKRKIALKLSKRANFYERTKQVTRVNRVTFSKQIGSKSFSRNEESPFLIDDYNFETSKREREREKWIIFRRGPPQRRYINRLGRLS